MDDIEDLRNRIKNRQKRDFYFNKKIISDPRISKIVSKILVTIILFLGLSITLKVYPNSREFLSKNLIEKNFSFASINNLYTKYFGDVLPVKEIFKEETKAVFKEELTYSNKDKYKDGVVLNVSKNYLIPIIESGMVVYIGEKEGYGNTVIVQQIDGIDTWYGNVNTTDVKLYEYVEKGSLLGETSDKLYVLFKKDGVVQDYNEFIK